MSIIPIAKSQQQTFFQAVPFPHLLCTHTCRCVQTVVLTLTVVWDLIAAVAVGCILSSLQFTRRMAEIEIQALQITSSHDLNGSLPSREESGLREEELQLMKQFSGVFFPTSF